MQVGLVGKSMDEGEVLREDLEGSGLLQVMEVSGSQVDGKKLPVESGVPGFYGRQILAKEGIGGRAAVS